MCLLMKQGKSSNLLSETDYIMLKKVITTSDGDMNGNDDKLLDDTKNEFKRLKIEGQRTSEQDAHYTQNNRGFYGYNRPSRKPFKFVPSNSRPGLWRETITDQSRNRSDARSQSSGGRRFQRNQKNNHYFDYRNRSASAASIRNASASSRASSVGRSSETHRIDKLEKILQSLVQEFDTLKKRIPDSSNVGFTEAEEIDTGVVLDNVFYVTDEVKTSMIVDGGCPSTLSGSEILDRYLTLKLPGSEY